MGSTIIQAATNLVSPVTWITLGATNPAALPVPFTDRPATNPGYHFYRIQLGP